MWCLLVEEQKKKEKHFFFNAGINKTALTHIKKKAKTTGETLLLKKSVLECPYHSF